MPAYVSSFAWSSFGPVVPGDAGRHPDPDLLQRAAGLSAGRARRCAASIRISRMSRARSAWAAGAASAAWCCRRSRPALGGGALLVAAHMLAEFGALSFLRVETFTTAIFDQYTAEFNNQAAALLSGVLMLICLPVAFAEARLRSGRRFARIGRGSARAHRRRSASAGWRRSRCWASSALTVLGFGVPLVTLGFWVWQGSSDRTGHRRRAAGAADLARLRAARRGADHAAGGAAGGRDDPFPRPLRHAVRPAALSGAWPARHRRGAGRGVPSRSATCRRSTRATALVLLVYAVLFLPLAQSAIRASAELVPRELADVARSLGKTAAAGVPAAPPCRTSPPASAPPWRLIALQLMRELTATLLLAPAGVVTLATEFWNYTSDRAYGAAAPFAAVLVLVSGIPVYIFTMRSLGSPTSRDARLRPCSPRCEVAPCANPTPASRCCAASTCTVPSGAIVALLGASGCGKTTLLRLIAGFEAADDGRIDAGRPRARGARPARARRAAPHRLRAAGRHAVPASDGRRQCRLRPDPGRAPRRPGRRGAAPDRPRRAWRTATRNQLSGGQQQRTALARALAPPARPDPARRAVQRAGPRRCAAASAPTSSPCCAPPGPPRSWSPTTRRRPSPAPTWWR